MADGKKKLRLDPILKKELRLGSRSIRLPLTVMFYDIVLAIIAVISIFVAGFAGSYDGGVDFSGFLYIFQVIGWTQLGISLLIVPILTAGTISGEREKQTLEILLTTPKKPLSIVWGKLMAALSNYLIYVISSIPIMAISFVLGGMNWFALLGYIFMMVVVAIYVGSIGVFCSSAFKKTIVAIVLTFVIEFALLIMTVVLFFMAIMVLALIHEAIYYDMLTAPDINFGILPLIMIGNPLTGFFDYMLRTMDATSLAGILKDADTFGVIMPFIAHAWIPMNLIVCAAISFFFLFLAARKLDPIRKSKKKKKKQAVGQVISGQPMQADAMVGGMSGTTGTLQGNPQLYQPHGYAEQQPAMTQPEEQQPSMTQPAEQQPVQNPAPTAITEKLTSQQ